VAPPAGTVGSMLYDAQLRAKEKTACLFGHLYDCRRVICIQQAYAKPYYFFATARCYSGLNLIDTG